MIITRKLTMEGGPRQHRILIEVCLEWQGFVLACDYKEEEEEEKKKRKEGEKPRRVA